MTILTDLLKKAAVGAAVNNSKIHGFELRPPGDRPDLETITKRAIQQAPTHLQGDLSYITMAVLEKEGVAEKLWLEYDVLDTINLDVLEGALRKISRLTFELKHGVKSDQERGLILRALTGAKVGLSDMISDLFINRLVTAAVQEIEMGEAHA